MRSTVLSLFWALFMITPMLGGCIRNTPADLAFLSVQIVDYHDRVELSSPGQNTASVASPAQRALAGIVNGLAERGRSGEKPHSPLLKAEFTTNVNLSEFIERN